MGEPVDGVDTDAARAVRGADAAVTASKSQACGRELWPLRDDDWTPDEIGHSGQSYVTDGRSPRDPTHLPPAPAGQHAGRVADLGHQHDLLARCGAVELRGV